MQARARRARCNPLLKGSLCIASHGIVEVGRQARAVGVQDEAVAVGILPLKQGVTLPPPVEQRGLNGPQ
eukprot:6950663-Lingulodinium_polyedra.AAC.1